MNNKDYLDLAHKNLRDTIKYRIQMIDGGIVYETEDFLLFSIGVDSADGHLNGCLSFNDEAYKKTFEEAQGFFNDFGFSYSFWIRDKVDEKLENLLLEKGYKPKRKPGSAIMAIDRKIEKVSLPEGYTLKQVETTEEIEDFAKVIEESFEKDKSTVETMFSSKESLISENIKSFLIYNKNSKPVSAAITSITEDASGIYYVGTVESERSKGLGKAIVEASTNIGFDMGKTLVILQASKLGEIVYEKLGYKTIGMYRSYGIEEE